MGEMDPLSLDRLLEQRRSIRKYRDEMPPEEHIRKMMKSAAQAPSPSNSQPVRFLRIASAPAREKLFRAMESGREKLLGALGEKKGSKRVKNAVNVYWRFSEFMFSAPLLFAVGCVPIRNGFSKRLLDAGLIQEDLRSRRDNDITTGLALKGFLLKGQELGLGTCILTAPLSFIEDLDKIPGFGELDITCFVTAGFADEAPSSPGRKATESIYSEI